MGSLCLPYCLMLWVLIDIVFRILIFGKGQRKIQVNRNIDIDYCIQYHYGVAMNFQESHVIEAISWPR